MHEREGARLGLATPTRSSISTGSGLPTTRSATVIAAAEQLGFAGLNVTHPFKQAVIAASRRALARGGGDRRGQHGRLPRRPAHRPQHRQLGLRRELPARAWRRAGSTASCCSARRRAALAVAHALLELGRRRPRRSSTRDADARRAAGASAGRALRRPCRTPSTRVATPVAAADGIVNATPVGMAKYPGMPFAAEPARSRGMWVADIVYFPAETELLRLARGAGLPHARRHGHGDLPGGRAFELFTGVAPDRDGDGAAFRGRRMTSLQRPRPTALALT